MILETMNPCALPRKAKCWPHPLGADFRSFRESPYFWKTLTRSAKTRDTRRSMIDSHPFMTSVSKPLPCCGVGASGRGVENISTNWKIRPGSRVLEVSVGTGQNIRFLPGSAAYFGLDISMGMLRRCRSNLKRWSRRAALLIQGAAEHLPFVDGAFDSVLHMGGINFFNDRAQALREMVRVAKPGTKIVIVDETEDIRRRYEKTPLTGSFYRGQHASASAPVEQLPSGMKEVRVKTIAGGELYCLTFRTPD